MTTARGPIGPSETAGLLTETGYAGGGREVRQHPHGPDVASGARHLNHQSHLRSAMNDLCSPSGCGESTTVGGDADHLTMRLTNCESALLHDAECPETSRRDIASTYGLAILSGEAIDWRRVNAAISERWGVRGLASIKAEAWRKVESAKVSR
jgi:hypothetical protein